MAPEQHDGADLDPRADQFSFCVTVYEALTGQRPFAGDSPEAIRSAIARGDVRWPASTRLPRGLPKIVERGLAEEPTARHPSMTELLQRLEAVRRRRGRRLRFAGLGVTLLLSSATTWALTTRDPVEAVDEVQTLADQARDAAARVLFVYPPPDDPDHPTAYLRVLQLEALGADEAREAAAELREEFAATLRRVGDEYWARDGGRAFAMDYYAQALVFAPDDAHARKRTTLTPGELAALRDKAGTGDFSATELDAGALLAALAWPEPEQRREAVKRYRARRPKARALSTELRLETLESGREPEPAPAAPRPVARADGEVEDEGALEVAVDDDEGSAGHTGPTSEVASPSRRAKRDPATAQRLIREADAALKRRDHAEASRLLHRALEADPRSAAAAARLSDVGFDRGRYDEAARWARRAVKLAPKTAAHHMRLGDALFKVLRYAEARKAYTSAQKLGAAGAAGRLRQIDERTGKAAR
jgi:hypothetical protein